MYRYVLFLWPMLITAGQINAQQVMVLWNKDIPFNMGISKPDTPSITCFLSPVASKPAPAVLVCPGGGYKRLAFEKEGIKIAAWLNSIGVHAFVLKYRYGPVYHHPVPLSDAQRALRLIREKAGEWELDTTAIGIMGFSAGGHLASTVGTHPKSGKPGNQDFIDRNHSRPDFMVLVYPVISFTRHAHSGSKEKLLGEKPDTALVQLLSNELQVKNDTPPCLIFHAGDDQTVPVENSLLFYEALKDHKIPAELHVFEKGGHGFGLAPDKPELHIWTTLTENWLKSRGILRK